MPRPGEGSASRQAETPRAPQSGFIGVMIKVSAPPVEYVVDGPRAASSEDVKGRSGRRATGLSVQVIEPWVVSTPGAENQPDNVPEADWAEQEIDADPVTEETDEPETQSVNLARGTTEANEADVAEQETGVYGEVDEYRG